MKMLFKILKLCAMSTAAAALLFWGAALLLDQAGIIPLHQITARFRFSPEHISRNAALRDVDDFFSTLERVHPDAKINIGHDAYVKLKYQTIAEVNNKSSENGSMTVRDLAYVLSYSAAAIGDGHTRINYSYDIDATDTRKRFLPFAVASNDGRFVISQDPGGQFGGAEIIAINGMPFKEFLQPVLEHISGETFKFRAYQFARDQSFWSDFSGLFSGLGSFNAVLRLKDGTIKKVRLNTVDAAGAVSGGSGTQGGGVSLAVYYKAGVGWISYASFDNSEQQKKEIAGIFKRLRAEGIRDLVLDFRGNLGGDSSMGDLIFSYISREKITQLNGKIKISKELIRAFPQLKHLKAHLGEVVNTDSDKGASPVPEDFFSGRVYLVVDNGSYSSASAFAAAFRDHKIGEILGYEAGEPLIAFGNALTFSLRHSGIHYAVSACRYFPRKPLPGDDKHGIIPDIVINDTLLRPYGGRVKDFVIDSIVKRRAQKGKQP